MRIRPRPHDNRLTSSTLALLAATMLLASCEGGDGAADAVTPDALPPQDTVTDVADDPGVDAVPDTPIPTDPGTSTDVPDSDPSDVFATDEGPADVWSFDVTIPESLGGDRPATLHVPAGYRPDRSWPLIVLLHGYGVSGYIQDLLMQLAPGWTRTGSCCCSRTARWTTTASDSGTPGRPAAISSNRTWTTLATCAG